jgi:cytochrome P450
MRPTPLPVPRAPGHLPLLGHMVRLWRRPFDFLTKLPELGPLVRVDMGTLPIYFVTTPELTHELLVTKQKSFDKGRFFDRLRDLAGNGLATAPREIHHRNRRIVQPVFHHHHLVRYATAMSRQAQALADSWKPGQELDMTKVMADYSIQVLSETMFGTDINRRAVETTLRYVPVIFKNLLYRAIMPRFLDHIPVPANRHFMDASRRLKDVTDEVILAARTRQRAIAQDEPDLLSLLLEASHDETGEQLTDREIRDELITFLNAGVETVAATMAWAWYEIASHPEVEQRLVAEITSVVGDRPVVFEDLPKLTYTRQVISETLRLHAVTLLMRRAVAPVTLAGVDLPVGTELAFSLYALHRDPRFYPDPDRFDPYRWDGEDEKTRRIAFVPFSAGTRKCIGDGFAWAETTIALATILPRWRLRLRGDHTPREVIAAVVRPDKVPVTALPRTT